MSRTTAAAVRAVLNVGDDVNVDVHIETANQLVTDLCSTSNYSEAKLELIERWLAAHFYSSSNSPQVQSQSVDGASETYAVATGMLFSQTFYGQQALLLDTRGKLAAHGKKIESGRIKIGTGYMGRISDNSDLYNTQSDMNMNDE